MDPLRAALSHLKSLDEHGRDREDKLGAVCKTSKYKNTIPRTSPICSSIPRKAHPSASSSYRDSKTPEPVGPMKFNSEKVVRSLKNMFAKNAAGFSTTALEQRKQSATTAVSVTAPDPATQKRSSTNTSEENAKNKNVEIIFCMQCLTIFTKPNEYDNHGCRKHRYTSSDDSDDEPDLVRGDDEPDLVRSDDEPDLVRGDDDPDLVRGDDEPDLVRGDREPDLVRGDDESDLVRGDGEPDLVRGDDEPDLVRGNDKPELVKSSGAGQLQGNSVCRPGAKELPGTVERISASNGRKRVSNNNVTEAVIPAKEINPLDVKRSRRKGRKRRRFTLSPRKKAKRTTVDKSAGTSKPGRKSTRGPDCHATFTCHHCEQAYSSRGGLLFHWKTFHKKVSCP